MYCVPSTVLIFSQVLTHLFLKTGQNRQYHFSFHMRVNRDTEKLKILEFNENEKQTLTPAHGMQ